MMPGRSALVIRHCKRVLLDTVQKTDTFVSITITIFAFWFVRMSLVCENKNNGEKFYRRNFMRAADEKQIINELGP